MMFFIKLEESLSNRYFPFKKMRKLLTNSWKKLSQFKACLLMPFWLYRLRSLFKH